MTVTKHPSTARHGTAPEFVWHGARRVLGCGAVAVALVLSACGGSASPAHQTAAGAGAASSSVVTAGSPAGGGSSGTGAKGDFCILVSADEAQAVLGVPVQPGLSRAGTGPGGLGASCQYKPTNDTGPATELKVIVLGTHISRSVYDQHIKGAAIPGSITPVPGLGQDAFATTGTVTVFDHGLVLTLVIIKGGNFAAAAVITALLRKALTRATGLR